MKSFTSSRIDGLDLRQDRASEAGAVLQQVIHDQSAEDQGTGEGHERPEAGYDRGQHPFTDRGSCVLGGGPGIVQRLPVETEFLDRVVLRCLDRRSDLVGLVEHATDRGGHDDGHHDEQPEHEHAGRETRLEPMSFEAPGCGFEDHGEHGREQEGERDLADCGKRGHHDDRGHDDAYEAPGPSADPGERSAGVALWW